MILRGVDGGSDAWREELRDHVAQVIGKIARPKLLLFTDDLPKTRSSARSCAGCSRTSPKDGETADTTTLRDPEIVQSIKEQADQQLGRAPKKS